MIKEQHYSYHLKYLEMIQSNIARMHDAAISIKRYAIVVFAVNVTAARIMNDSSVLLVINFVVMLFWLMDAQYLNVERQFRALFRQAVIAKERGDSVSFAMNTKFSVQQFVFCIVSWSVAPIYIAMVVISFSLWSIATCNGG